VIIMVSFVSVIAVLAFVAVIGLAITGYVVVRSAAQDQALLEARVQQMLERQIELADLAEFRDLDPAYREAYKRMIVDKLMPAVVRRLNKEQENIAPKLKADGPVSKFVDLLVQALDGDIKATMKLMAATAAQPEQTVETFVDSDYFASRLTHAIQVATAELRNNLPRDMAQ
jgi:Na+-transporting NADH:ubiquinone oxidoreductase subunit NqrC